MKRLIACLSATVACLFLSACAHPIGMTPDLALVGATSGTKVIDRGVGYYIPDALNSLEVTTPGGGGDKVRYFPYRDLEPGFYKALTSVFRQVTKMKDPKDAAAARSGNVSLLLTPQITTTSSSGSPFTWPPTEFVIDLACAITDPDGKPIQTVRVSGSGNAQFDEFKSNFSLSAVRAANDALAKLIKALGDMPELQK